MESFLRKTVILFIICMLAIILIFLGINYKSDQDAKTLKKSKAKETEKVEKKNKEEKAAEENNVSNESSIDNRNNSEDNNTSNSNELENRNIPANSNTASSTNNNYNNNNSSVNSTTIPISKFGSRISNNKLNVGETANITTTIYPENATEKEVSYTSSDKNIAIVSKDGVVTGINIGECYITISVKGVENSGQLKVYVVPKTSVNYSNNETQE